MELENNEYLFKKVNLENWLKNRFFCHEYFLIRQNAGRKGQRVKDMINLNFSRGFVEKKIKK